MDRDERELFARTIAAALEGDDVDTEPERLGWAEALAADRQAAVSILFEQQGATNTTSSALDWLLAPATVSRRPGSGLDPELGVVTVEGPLSDEALAIGRLALAHEIVGGCRTMLEL